MYAGPVVVVGLGQMGSELVEGLRDAGRDVVVVHRDELGSLASHDGAAAVVLAVPEDVLGEVAALVPAALRGRVVLLQNELVPASWRSLGLESPTVAVVWFERKGGRPPRPILPTLVGGPSARVILDALAQRGIPAREIDEAVELVPALVAKNLYIVTSNLAGLGAMRRGPVPGSDVAWPDGAVTMGDLLGLHPDFARALAREVFAIEEARLDGTEREGVDFDSAWAVVLSAVAADPEHACMGRSAPARLARAAKRARERRVEAPIVSALAVATDV